MNFNNSQAGAGGKTGETVSRKIFDALSGREAKAEGAADFGKLADDAAAKKSFRRRMKEKLG
jgi:hypothetical protein